MVGGEIGKGPNAGLAATITLCICLPASALMSSRKNGKAQHSPVHCRVQCSTVQYSAVQYVCTVDNCLDVGTDEGQGVFLHSMYVDNDNVKTEKKKGRGGGEEEEVVQTGTTLLPSPPVQLRADTSTVLQYVYVKRDCDCTHSTLHSTIYSVLYAVVVTLHRVLLTVLYAHPPTVTVTVTDLRYCTLLYSTVLEPLWAQYSKEAQSRVVVK